MDNSCTRIIYEDDFIVVVFHQGERDTCIVTYGDMITLANGVNFYAEKAVKKLGLTAVGFMAKTRNWYPSQSVRNALSVNKALLEKVKPLVSYGGSMGGYAAIKYSSSLRCSHTIAFCPQWSIDPEECGDFSSGYERYFRKRLKSMSIKEEDVSGSIALFFDPGHSGDSWHADKIKELHKEVALIKVPMVNHHVTTVLAGTSRLQEIIDLVMANKMAELQSMTNSIRRASPIRARILLGRSVMRHPKLVWNVIKKNKAILIGTNVDGHLTQLIKKLLINNDTITALEVHSQLSSRHLEPARWQMADRLMKGGGEVSHELPSRTILTCHGTVLCYDPILGELCHKDQQIFKEAKFLLPVYVAEDEKGTHMTISCGRTEHVIHLSMDKAILAPDANDIPAGVEFVESTTMGYFSISLGHTYVTAARRGIISYDRTQVKKWELYHCYNSPND